MKIYFMAAFVCVISFSQMACAQPNYQDTRRIGSPDQDQKSGACETYFKTQDLCLSYGWIVAPTEEATGSLQVKFTTPAGVAHDPAAAVLKIVLWMPMMGHGSSPVKVIKQGEGQFLGEGVFFSMPGEWEIKFQLLNAGAVIEEQLVTVQF